jgi:hypothetical protein
MGLLHTTNLEKTPKVEPGYLEMCRQDVPEAVATGLLFSMN